VCSGRSVARVSGLVSHFHFAGEGNEIMTALGYIVEIHRSGDLGGLILLYGGLMVGALVLALQVLWARSRRFSRVLGQELWLLRRQAEDRDRQLEKGLAALALRTEDNFGRVKSGLEERIITLRDQMGGVELHARRSLEEVSTMRVRVDEATAGVAERMGVIDARAQRTLDEMEMMRQRVGDVEKGMPRLYEQLDEFRETLARIFRNELGSVFNSFDSSISAVLEHMKAELHVGINRIEGIEQMVHSRHQAEHTLLGPADDEELMEAALDGAADAGQEAPAEEQEAEETLASMLETADDEDPWGAFSAEAEAEGWEQDERAEAGADELPGDLADVVGHEHSDDAAGPGEVEAEAFVDVPEDDELQPAVAQREQPDEEEFPPGADQAMGRAA